MHYLSCSCVLGQDSLQYGSTMTLNQQVECKSVMMQVEPMQDNQIVEATQETLEAILAGTDTPATDQFWSQLPPESQRVLVPTANTRV